MRPLARYSCYFFILLLVCIIFLLYSHENVLRHSQSQTYLKLPKYSAQGRRKKEWIENSSKSQSFEPIQAKRPKQNESKNVFAKEGNSSNLDRGRMNVLKTDTRFKNLEAAIAAPPAKMAILLLAANRASTLNVSLSSWSKVYKLKNYTFVVSLDTVSKSIDKVVHYWRGISNWDVSAIQSYQAHVEQVAPSDERIGRHWLSSVTRMFNDGFDYVLYCEDDHFVSPDALLAAEKLISHDSICPECFSMNLGCHRDCWKTVSTNMNKIVRMESGNMGVIYKKSTWQALLANVQTFCKMRGNWDVNLHILGAMKLVSFWSLSYTKSRIFHLETCYSSRLQRSFNSVEECQKRWRKQQTTFLSSFQDPNEVDRFLVNPLLDVGRAHVPKPSVKYPPAPTSMENLCLSSVTGNFFEENFNTITLEKGRSPFHGDASVEEQSLKVVSTSNLNTAAMKCRRDSLCGAFLFEKDRNKAYFLTIESSKNDLRKSETMDLYRLHPDKVCQSHRYPLDISKRKGTPTLTILIPTKAGRKTLCQVLQSIRCHSPYLSGRGRAQIIIGGRALSKMNCPLTYEAKYAEVEDTTGRSETVLRSWRRPGQIQLNRQKQTADFVALLESAKITRSESKFVLILDDDAIWCENFADEVERIMANVEANNVRAAFLGQGSSGMLLRSSDVANLKTHLCVGMGRSNVDVLMYTWTKTIAGVTLLTKFNLMRHIGFRSTFKDTSNYEDDNFCGMPRVPTVFGVTFPAEINIDGTRYFSRHSYSEK